MNLDEYIAVLEALRREHGGTVPVVCCVALAEYHMATEPTFDRMYDIGQGYPRYCRTLNPSKDETLVVVVD